MMTVQAIYQFAIFGNSPNRRQRMVTGAYWGWTSDIIYQIGTYYVNYSLTKLAIQILACSIF